MSQEPSLAEAVDRVDAAVREQDLTALANAYAALRGAVVAASEAERAAVVGGLAAVAALTTKVRDAHNVCDAAGSDSGTKVVLGEHRLG